MRCAWLLAAAAMGLAANAVADDPAPKFEIVTPKDDGIAAVDINARGEVVGFEWVEEADRPGVVSQKPFFARGKEMTYLPLLKGYTTTEPAAVSDEGLVVGRVGKPAPPRVRVANRSLAFVWDAKDGIRAIGTLEGDATSAASGVTGDGRRISGYSVGENRIRACYWERVEGGWKAVALPQKTAQAGTVVAISDNGKFVAALDGGIPCLWAEGPAGDWKREEIGAAGELVPRGVNNDGVVVGLRYTDDGNYHAVIWTRAEGLQALRMPAGIVRSEASAVNNAGAVVGMMDGPPGSKPGPRGFAYEAGKIQTLGRDGLPFAGATAINDRRQVAGTLEKDEDEQPPDAEGKPADKSKR